MSTKKDLTEPVSPPRRSSITESPTKKQRVEEPIVKGKPAIISPSDPLRTPKETKQTPTLKPLPGAPEPMIQSEPIEETPKEPSLKEIELARWTPEVMASIPKYKSPSMSDDAIIRRKLMFEAGNPPASSHRGLRLFTTNIASLVNGVKTLRPTSDLDPIIQRIQLYLRQEELTLIRLITNGQSLAKISRETAKHPVEISRAVDDVKNQILAQKHFLDQANQAELRFKDYVDFANSIRKLSSFEDLVKNRNDLKEETKRLREERDLLDRQQAEKYPFFTFANFALNHIKFSGNKSGDSRQKTRVVSLSNPKEHSKKESAVKHRKSPKKSSKETRT